ncbi:class I SAM-dependent methyltransferase [Jatrophihabitans sp.]|uniref:class I SAM-dependent methyltransferase n=1 Tax=Jatrophihabitans sp. TaxID=1932789 RepID=UPI002EFE41CB
MSDLGWDWDPTLYAGSAAYYVQGRVSYTQELVDALVAELALDGSGRLLDVGCGPGSLTLLLAPWFEQAVGLDADAEMLAEGARQAETAGISNVGWVNLRAEDLPADPSDPSFLGPFRAVTLAQSFHWMDRALVARRLHGALAPDGALVHVHATTHQGVDGDLPLPHPRPPRREIELLVRRFLGSRRRAGQGTLPDRAVEEAARGHEESEIYRAAGFSGPTRIEVPGTVVDRSADDVVASVFSLSSAAPHLFGDRGRDFEAALRELLAEVSPDGRFSEQMRETAVDVWRR